jgi:hypothetical protein
MLLPILDTPNENIAKYFRKYDGIKIYDYSLSNIKILNANGFTNTHHLPYLIYKEEQDFLKNLKQTIEPIYDFGIISLENPVIVERRLAVVNFLTNNGYTVKVIQGFKEQRDKQIAMCRTLLNIHGSNCGEVSKIFEHIRCDRLLAAGYKILSEDCLHLSSNFVSKYADNLKIISYSNFFNVDTYKEITKTLEPNIKVVKKYCFIHSCTFQHSGTQKLDYIIEKINSSGLINALDNVFINNIGIPIENKYNLSNTSNKYILSNYSQNPRLYENPTINAVRRFADQNPDSYILYLHTKGNSYDSERQSINDWTEMMLYFLVEKYEQCTNKMETEFDTVGCNYSEVHHNHYSGNFWWAKSSYIRTLNYLSEDVPNKMAPEFWVLQNNPNKYTIHSSGVDHYYTLYPRSHYSM